MLTVKEQPFYIRLAFKLAIILLIGLFIQTEKIVVVPLYFAVLLSILLLPLANLFEKLKFPRALAALVSVLLALIFIGSIVWFLSDHLTRFTADIPSIKTNINEHLATLQAWVEQKFSISSEQQSRFFKSAGGDSGFPGTAYIGQTLLTVTQTVLLIVIVIIYSFLILYYRHLIQKVIFALYNKAHQVKVQEALEESKTVVKRYMQGLVIEMLIIATANCTVLLLIGIKYAVFLGVLAAVLNIIPYIGILVGMIFTVLVTLGTTASLHQIIWIVISMEIIHFIDANFLMPRIVGSRVKINALMTILGAVTGGSLIGIPGVFLALPTIAMLKIVFDRVEDLKPWGMLLGDETPASPIVTQIKKLTTKRKK
jgi:predicted PurR-regulated permease PerM